ncbi:hypothetical protein [Citricoccus nitrophenolicus]|uniref:hypothetical protein n=1 Tax=Citricoccus nitrophenolicus TaxID=863575 RepID=UPI0031E65F2A
MSTMTTSATTDFFQGVERGSFALVLDAVDRIRSRDLQDPTTASRFLAAESEVRALAAEEQAIHSANIQFINGELEEANDMAAYAELHEDDEGGEDRFSRVIDLNSTLRAQRARAELLMDEGDRLLANYSQCAHAARSYA